MKCECIARLSSPRNSPIVYAQTFIYEFADAIECVRAFIHNFTIWLEQLLDIYRSHLGH